MLGVPPPRIMPPAIGMGDVPDGHRNPRSRRDAHSDNSRIIISVIRMRRSTGRFGASGSAARAGPRRGTRNAAGAEAPPAVANDPADGAYATAPTTRDHHSRCAASDPL